MQLKAIFDISRHASSRLHLPPFVHHCHEVNGTLQTFQGLDKVLATIKNGAQEDDYFWEPAPLLEKLVAEGRSFDDLNKE